MVSQIQVSSPLLERLARVTKPPDIAESERAEAVLSQVTDLAQLLTQATLLAAGFHTHHRQWRRKRNVGNY